MVLPGGAWYGRSGVRRWSEAGYAATALRLCYELSGTDGRLVLRICYAVSGAEIGYAATALCDV
eukprot:205169-Rhodomonas_salina.2